MKKVLILISACALLASCSTVKVQGDVTSFGTYPNGVSVGFTVQAAGSYQAKIDSLVRGFKTDIAGQSIQILHTDTSVILNGMVNLKYK